MHLLDSETMATHKLYVKWSTYNKSPNIGLYKHWPTINHHTKHSGMSRLQMIMLSHLVAYLLRFLSLNFCQAGPVQGRHTFS